MDKDFIPYEESLVLKNLGFDESCLSYYSESFHGGFQHKILKVYSQTEYAGQLCSVPLYQQAFRWFMDVHGLYVEPFVDDDKTFGFLVSYFLPDGRADMPIKRQFKTAIERDLACIQFLINTVKEGKHLYP